MLLMGGQIMEKNNIYKCETCGNVVELVSVGGGSLICCGQEMKLYLENSVDAAKEKHVPVIEKVDGGTKVKVGSVSHPMEEKHYIEWIEIINGDYVNRKYLNPGEVPEAVFYVEYKETMKVRAYCNLHGLWKA
jgi:superoxide reductase